MLLIAGLLILLRILLILLILLLILLLLLVVRLLCLLARLFHELLKFLDLFLHLLGLLAVGEKNLLVADDGSVARGGTHAFAVKFLRPVQFDQGFVDSLFSRVKVLRLKLLRGALHGRAGVEV